MNYYAIASGGTGSMCIRSLIFMLVAHYLNPAIKLDGTVYIRIVDMDYKSDAKQECETLIQQYNILREQANRGVNGGIALPEIVLESWDFTAAVRHAAFANGINLDQKKEVTLRGLFEHDGKLDAHTEKLLNTFFTGSEQTTTLDKGFYGHPNIGAIVFNYVRDDFLSETIHEWQNNDWKEHDSVFMKALNKDLATVTGDERVPVYLYGSLFGGTGASVIPNLIDVLRSIPAVDGRVGPNGQPPEPWGISRLRLGTTMLLPYFRLPDPNGEERANTLRPDHNRFWSQTQEALKYYEEFHVKDKVDSLLLVGNKRLDVTSEIYARGAKQYQHFHVVLMVAAAAGLRFFRNEPSMNGLLKWNVSPENNGEFQSLTFGELGLGPEADALQIMFRFSIVVTQYMYQRFWADVDKKPLHERLNQMEEVYQTCKQECHVTPVKALFKGWNANLTVKQLDEYYKDPVKAAREFCKSYLEYFFDCAASGYDWTKYHTWSVSSSNGEPVPGEKSSTRFAGMGDRFVDLVNLQETDKCIEADLTAEAVEKLRLGTYFGFDCVDAGRRVDAQFVDASVGTLYDDARKAAFKKGDIDADFSNIYKACYEAAAKVKE